MPLAKQVTGQNHVQPADAEPRASRLGDDLHILEHFVGHGSIDSGTCVTNLGFLVVGHDQDVAEFLQITRGMPFCETYHTEIGIRCLLVSGSVCDWQRAAIDGNRWTLERSTQRRVWNAIYHQLVQLGLGHLFHDFRPVTKEGVLLLEVK
jgi:hypothetical protein